MIERPLNMPAGTHAYLDVGIFVRRILLLSAPCYYAQVFFLWRYKRMRFIVEKYGILFISTRPAIAYMVNVPA